MSRIRRRRRALMGDRWEDITGQLSFFTYTGTSYERSGNDINVRSTSDGTYRALRANFATSADYAYKYTCDSVTVTDGVGLISCRTATATIINATSSGKINASTGPIEVEFSHSPNIALLSLFCTFETPETGDVTYHNFRLWRRRL